MSCLRSKSRDGNFWVFIFFLYFHFHFFFSPISLNPRNSLAINKRSAKQTRKASPPSSSIIDSKIGYLLTVRSQNRSNNKATTKYTTKKTETSNLTMYATRAKRAKWNEKKKRKRIIKPRYLCTYDDDYLTFEFTLRSTTSCHIESVFRFLFAFCFFFFPSPLTILLYFRLFHVFFSSDSRSAFFYIFFFTFLGAHSKSFTFPFLPCSHFSLFFCFSSVCSG